MAENLILGDNCCCRPGISGLRLLTFPDGSRVGITGFDAVVEEVYQEGKPANLTTAKEIMERLKGRNYFATSAAQIYQELFLAEYKQFVELKSKSIIKESNTMANQDNAQNKKKGLFGFLKNDKKAANESGCCNMKIVPQEQPPKEPGKGCCCNMRIVPKESSEDKTSK
jgi:hypothetical protein